MITKITGAKRLHRRFIIEEEAIIVPLINESFEVYSDAEIKVTMVEVAVKDEKKLFSFVDKLKAIVAKEKCLQVETVRTYHEQGTDEWLTTRKGFFTSSTHWVGRTGEKTPTEDTKAMVVGIDRYLKTLPATDPLIVAHSEATNGFKNKTMERGNQLEKVALDIYEKQTGYNVDMDIDFRYVKGSLIGTSVDGISTIMNEATIVNEVKCPNLYNFLDDDYYLEHYAQVQQHLYVLKLEECDFIKYFPNLPLSINRIKIDYAFIYNMLESEKRLRPKVDDAYFNLMELHLSS